jgi:predicted secreted protein
MAATMTAVTMAMAGPACNGSAPPPNAVDPSASAAPSSSADAPSNAEKSVTLEDDGKSITLARGATFAVKLAAQSGTGYSWAVTKVDGAAVTAVGHKETEGTPQMPGAPMREVFRFTAAAAGTATVELALRRPWEKDVAPARTFHVSVTVP